MMMRRLISTILTCLMSVHIYASDSLVKKRALADLDVIHSIFEVKYAPLEWKQEFTNWNLDQAIDEAKSKINALVSPTTKDCQIILRNFFNSTKDYHAVVHFYSTESASLPFLIKGAEGRYFVSFVDRKQISLQEFPFQVGDEIIHFDGRPVGEAIEELRIQKFGTNVFATDLAFAELSLTHRKGSEGDRVPSGSLIITGKKKETAAHIQSKLKWSYIPEQIRDFAKLQTSFRCQGGNVPNLSKSLLFKKFMVSPLWDRSNLGELNKHSLGARSSYIPPLGKKVWKTNSENFFDAYIFKSPSGKRIGYIRIANYGGAEEEVEEFGEIMNLFQNETDALVIDQINNPGGSVFYLYGLVSTLADQTFYAPKHRIALTQEEVNLALQLLLPLGWIQDDESAKLCLGDTMEGYPVDYEFSQRMKIFCNFLIDQWNAGKIYSDPTFLFGMDGLDPHPKYRYSKPILLLVNSLDISGGDFFPAILQDNKRALVMGTRTAGAGGYVVKVKFPNHSGMRELTLTGSHALRLDQKPLENLGVHPDIPYEISAFDIQNNYQHYVLAIQDAVENLLISDN